MCPISCILTVLNLFFSFKVLTVHSKKPWQHTDIIVAKYYHGSNQLSKCISEETALMHNKRDANMSQQQVTLAAASRMQSNNNMVKWVSSLKNVLFSFTSTFFVNQASWIWGDYQWALNVSRLSKFTQDENHVVSVEHYLNHVTCSKY